jgi:hypothetical protein
MFFTQLLGSVTITALCRYTWLSQSEVMSKRQTSNPVTAGFDQGGSLSLTTSDLSPILDLGKTLI